MLLLLLLSTFKKATNSSLCLPLRGLSIDVSRKFIIKGQRVNSAGLGTKKYWFFPLFFPKIKSKQKKVLKLIQGYSSKLIFMYPTSVLDPCSQPVFPTRVPDPCRVPDPSLTKEREGETRKKGGSLQILAVPTHSYQT